MPRSAVVAGLRFKLDKVDTATPSSQIRFGTPEGEGYCLCKMYSNLSRGLVLFKCFIRSAHLACGPVLFRLWTKFFVFATLYAMDLVRRSFVVDSEQSVHFAATSAVVCCLVAISLVSLMVFSSLTVVT